MNDKTYKLYMSIAGVEVLVNENIKGERNIGSVMSKISGVTSQVGVNTYDTALELVERTKGLSKPADPVTSKLVAAIKAASKS